MKKKDIEIEFAMLRGEFKVIKILIYIILAALFGALIGFLIKQYSVLISEIPTIVGNVVKDVPSQPNLTLTLIIFLIVSVIAGLIIIKRKEKK